MSPRTSALHRAVGLAGVVVMAAGLTSCSAATNLTAPASTSRMVKPTEVPQVDDPTNADEGEPTDSQSDFTDLLTQLWVRDVAFDRSRGQYTITVASARSGEFMLHDMRPTNGADLSPSDNHDCRVVSTKPLSPRIKSAIASTNTLYTLTCPGGPMALPVLEGNWYSATSGGSTSAVIAIGGPQAQGIPDDPQRASDDASASVPEVSVESSRLEGKRATVVVWATEGSILRLAPTEETGEGEFTVDQCTVHPTGAHRPRSSGPARLARYTMQCNGVSSLATMNVDARYASGLPGKSPSFAGMQTAALTPAR